MSALDCSPFDNFERKLGDDHPIEDNNDQKQDRAVQIQQRNQARGFANRFSKRPKLNIKYFKTDLKL